MEDKVRERLDLEIEVLFDNLGCLDPDAESYANGIDNVVKLYKLRLEEDKAPEKEKKSDRWIRFGLEVGKILLPLAVYVGTFMVGMEFEKTGTFTFQTFKNSFKNLKLPT